MRQLQHQLKKHIHHDRVTRSHCGSSHVGSSLIAHFTNSWSNTLRSLSCVGSVCFGLCVTHDPSGSSLCPDSSSVCVGFPTGNLIIQMGHDGYMAQKNIGFVSNKERYKTMLDKPPVTNGKKAWFCSVYKASDVWTRETCRTRKERGNIVLRQNETGSTKKWKQRLPSWKQSSKQRWQEVTQTPQAELQ